MADIFKLIRGMSHTERTPRTEKNNENKKSERIELDDFLIGEDEKPLQSKRKRTKDIKSEIKNSILDELIGDDQDTNDHMRNITKIDFIQLNKEPEKRQNVTLKREYLTLLDKIEELNKELSKLSKFSSDTGIELHQAIKEQNRIKEVIRTLGSMIPDNKELKDTLNQMNWKIEDIEDDLVSSFQRAIDRIKNADEYVEEKMKLVNQENKNLKRLILHMESEKTDLEQQLENVSLRHQTPPNQPTSTETSSLEETAEPQISQEEEELIKLEQEIEEKRKVIEKNNIKKENNPPKPLTEKTLPNIANNKIEEYSTRDYKEEETIEQEEEEEIDTHMLLDVERHIQILPEARKYIIEVIGQTGISRNQELRTFLENDEKGKSHFQKGTKFNYQDMSAATKGLKDSGYLLAEKVNLGSKGGYNFQVFELSDIGKAIYKVISKKGSVPPEKKSILSQHKSLEHGYLIKDCATEFEEMGYKVFTERQDLRFDLPEGKRKDFDIIIEKDDEKCFIEVERGTHTDEDFFNAMDKIYKVMQNLNRTPAEFHFVSPNEQVLFGKTKRQFFLWIKQRLGGIEETKGKITVHFTTFDKVKKRQKNLWETINL